MADSNPFFWFERCGQEYMQDTTDYLRRNHLFDLLGCCYMLLLYWVEWLFQMEMKPRSKTSHTSFARTEDEDRWTCYWADGSGVEPKPQWFKQEMGSTYKEWVLPRRINIAWDVPIIQSIFSLDFPLRKSTCSGNFTINFNPCWPKWRLS